MSIKSFLEQPDWIEIEAMLLEEFCNKPLKLKTDGKSNETIASEIKGLEYSAKAIKRFIAKIKRIKTPVNKEKEVWR